MDPRLSEAATKGDVEALDGLLKEDPLILERVALAPYAETPLHIVALAGKTDFAKLLINRMPAFARELNHDGFSPLHIASAIGHIEIVTELLALGPNLCLLKDKGGRTPLHWAVIKGRIDVVEKLLSKCPQAIKEVTAMGETPLHLAVKNSQFEALRVLVKNLDDNNGEIINAKDNEGNSILQLAMATKQLQVLDLIRNESNLDKEDIVEVLSGDNTEGRAEIMPQTNLGTRITNQKPSLQQSQSTQDKSETIWSEVEDMVLVVASLIATVTYQAGLAPPQTIWKENMKLESKCIFHGSNSTSLTNSTNTCPAVTYYLFMSFNTAGFFSSLFLIFSFRNPAFVQVLLPISLISMMVTYITLSITMSPNGLAFLIIYLITLVVFLYCVMAIEVTKRLFHSIIDKVSGGLVNMVRPLASGKGILRSVARKKKSSAADVSILDA
ncbi:hypothetical protein F0562_022453 [Nyssa sinensis]|uniref:PGG domain-containing protein n=1 Tax=Nyssa sinensis TaxID=561372 RepID=A0A5J5BRZ1_9ASTE|nr:hypothetical protein F0562_022453 [Nyssa sinensis]